MRYKSAITVGVRPSCIDKEKGIIRDVVIVSEGLDKNGGYFTYGFLAELSRAGNRAGLGIKCHWDHPSLFRVNLGTFLGRYRNFRLKQQKGKSKIVADLHLDPITQKVQVQGMPMWDYIMEMAERNSDVFGNSIVFSSKAEHKIKTVDNKQIRTEIYSDLEAFYSSDLVDTPAATESLFKERGDSFPCKSFSNKNQKQTTKTKESDMDIIKKVMRTFSSRMKDLELSLADGSAHLVILTEGNEPCVGDQVRDDGGNSVEDGVYLLSDGSSLTVQQGKIAAIDEPESTDETTEQIKALRVELAQMKQEHKKNQLELTEALSLIVENYKVMKGKYETLARNVKGKASFAPIDAQKALRTTLNPDEVMGYKQEQIKKTI